LISAQCISFTYINTIIPRFEDDNKLYFRHNLQILDKSL
jgi:hypothetical protein